MTLAEQWRVTKPKDWASVSEYISHIHEFDPCSFFQITELGLIIIFSDKSKHRMGSCDPQKKEKITNV